MEEEEAAGLRLHLPPRPLLASFLLRIFRLTCRSFSLCFLSAAVRAFRRVVGRWQTMSMAGRLRYFINSPTGPKTTHFWGPVANWGFVLAVRAAL
jgi:hypothetical protein